MPADAPYFPHQIFSPEDADPPILSRVIIFPGRYVQGPGVLDHLGRYLSLLPSKRPAILISAGGQKRFGDRLRENLAKAGISPRMMVFEGECSYEAVDRMADALKKEDKGVDAVVAVGGGKCLDAGKCVAFRCGVPVVTCPTIASTDAPCSAVSVMYTEAGVQIGVEFFPNNPVLVVVDTRIIAQSPIRHLIAGMGDALATCYEARTNFNNAEARSIVGARPTITALALAELCARTVLEKGLDAVAAVSQNQVNEALEQIVEANTLLSGVGFESGGLAASHAVAEGLTVIPALHDNYLHGELVGVGVLTHLILEDQRDEAGRIATFLARVGLPVHAGQLCLDLSADEGVLMEAMQKATETPLMLSEPFKVTPESLFAAFCDAHQLGMQTAAAIGDQAFGNLHGADTGKGASR